MNDVMAGAIELASGLEAFLLLCGECNIPSVVIGCRGFEYIFESPKYLA